MLQDAQMTPDQAAEALNKPTWGEVVALLRDQPRRRFSIDIETDSLVAPDDAEQQQERTQFIEAITGFINQAGEIASADPSSIPLLGELLKFGASGFRVGRDLMDCIDSYIDEKVKQSKQPQPPKPDPAMAQVQARAQTDQTKLQLQDQQHQRELAADVQQHQAELEHDSQLEALKAHFQQQTEAMNARFEAAQRQQETMLDVMTERFKALLDARTKIEVAEVAAGAAITAEQIGGAQQAAGGD
jgi:hypothetical protein